MHTPNNIITFKFEDLPIYYNYYVNRIKAKEKNDYSAKCKLNELYLICMYRYCMYVIYSGT